MDKKITFTDFLNTHDTYYTFIRCTEEQYRRLLLDYDRLIKSGYKTAGMISPDAKPYNGFYYLTSSGRFSQTAVEANGSWKWFNYEDIDFRINRLKIDKLGRIRQVFVPLDKL